MEQKHMRTMYAILLLALSPARFARSALGGRYIRERSRCAVHLVSHQPDQRWGILLVNGTPQNDRYSCEHDQHGPLPTLTTMNSTARFGRDLRIQETVLRPDRRHRAIATAVSPTRLDQAMWSRSSCCS